MFAKSVKMNKQFLGAQVIYLKKVHQYFKYCFLLSKPLFSSAILKNIQLIFLQIETKLKNVTDVMTVKIVLKQLTRASSTELENLCYPFFIRVRLKMYQMKTKLKVKLKVRMECKQNYVIACSRISNNSYCII